MSSAVVALITLILFFLAYRFYARFLSLRIFGLFDEKKLGPTPAHQFKDGIDYVPTKRSILFGHHFSSISGAAPIVGPAVAVIWGWVPAIIWIVVGVIFMGAAHDFGCLVLSLKHQGKSMGQLGQDILGPRVQKLFLIVIFFLLWLVIAVFALVIANLFIQFPSSVIPVNFEIIIALVMGILINKRNMSMTLPSILAQLGLLVMIVIGTKYPISLAPWFGDQELVAWMIFLLIYSFIASILPVWVLLQPRDYINSHQLMVGLTLLIAGLFVSHPPIVAPAFNPTPMGAPPWFPFLFITIACGAISGFHGLVSSGTTSKQVDKWMDSKYIGYGSMLCESVLALIATLAAVAGFESTAHWHSHYSSWNSANGLAAKIKAFVIGSGSFLEGIGIPQDISHTVVAVLIISFAATSLDTATRIQRYIIGEMGDVIKVPQIKNRYVGAFLAVFTAFILMFSKDGGKGGLALWPLFGATNQMLAGLSLLVITIYLLKMRQAIINYLLPAIFILAMTSIGLVMNINKFYAQKNWFLLLIGSILLLSQTWMVIEGILAFKKNSHQT